MQIEDFCPEDYNLELESIEGPYRLFLDTENNEGTKDLITSRIIDEDETPLRLTINGILSSRGVMGAKKTAYGISEPKLGITLTKESKNKINDVLAKLENVNGVDDGTWISKRVFFQGNWYPKFKIDPDNSNRYQAVTVPQISPKKVHPDILKGTKVTIITEVAAWFSFSKEPNALGEQNKMGLFFNFDKVTFHIGDQESFVPKSKRVNNANAVSDEETVVVAQRKRKAKTQSVTLDED